MQICPECGNHDVRPKQRSGGVVHECGMCGAVFGDRAAVERAAIAAEAAQRGFAPEVWAVARGLDGLPGLRLVPAPPLRELPLPEVELLVTDGAALVQLENVAKSLRLAAGGLRCAWRIELRYEHALQAVLTCAVGGAEARDAWIDAELLGREFARNRRASWWRHANGAGNG